MSDTRREGPVAQEADMLDACAHELEGWTAEEQDMYELADKWRAKADGIRRIAAGRESVAGCPNGHTASDVFNNPLTPGVTCWMCRAVEMSGGEVAGQAVALAQEALRIAVVLRENMVVGLLPANPAAKAVDDLIRLAEKLRATPPAAGLVEAVRGLLHSAQLVVDEYGGTPFERDAKLREACEAVRAELDGRRDAKR